MVPENVHILVVDDEADIRLMVKTALGQEGYIVNDAPDAESALELLNSNSFELVLTDINLPGMDGLQLLDKMKKKQPNLGVIMMTGFKRSYDLNEALLEGADEYISKPFEMDTLLKVVEKTYWRTIANNMKMFGEVNEQAFNNLLVSMNIVSEEDIKKAAAKRREHEKYLAHTLVRLKLCAEDVILSVLADHLGVEYLSLKDTVIEQDAIDKVPAKFAHHYKVMPVRMDGMSLVLATMDPLDVHVLDDINLLLGFKVKAYLAGEEQIMSTLKQYYGLGADTVEQMIDEEEDILELPEIEETAIDSDDLAQDASIIKFVNQIFLEAYKDRATDIHIEPFEGELRIRNRIDGILYETNVPVSLKRFQSAIVSRIKIMANLNIAERRLPQDGRIKLKLSAAELDLRVSTLPTPYGETTNIRLLTVNNKLLNLNELGYGEKELEILDRIIKKPHGIILVTGPTGSGKSTTLYACLKTINSDKMKVITIEDPIEYRMHGISQIQVLPKIDLTFARALRSMLRHDPDIMMIGEIRDYETAEASIRAALTGHLVFSTIHTNDAAGSVTRLIDMGVEPYLVSSSVECVIAQRLVRVICPSCKHEIPFNPIYLKEFKDIEEFDPNSVRIYEGKGCDACKGTGYKGRTVIYEIMVMTDSIREMVVERVPANRIKDVAVKEQKMTTLKHSGLKKVLRGITTVDEVLRVAQEEILY
ncbi:Flp pilus assembly complex ATPase component TadA [bacterium]|nr:Flp pilus assembly complex ATPase component TadA [bacterium]